ncbi:DUF6281 family protein [Streptomyces sp. NBC_01320]|uniref:DUF6281 family protein n=1 Tax=Streptomyces sp. NBC_01320 TaxID=2903824 RepID=UPI002E12B88D|nr:DUF6281 family protein [Streptomyces sp. NBC_01320]
MSWGGRTSGVLLAAAIMVSTAACSATGSNDGEESCAIRFTYQDRTYEDVANVDFTVGQKLGTVTEPPCNDVGGQDGGEESPESVNAYRVEGVSPEAAIAVGATPDEAVFVASYVGDELPPEVQKLIDGA